MTETLYKEYILDLYKHPLNKGRLENATIQNGSENALCGDRVFIMAYIDEQNIITHIRHDGDGCVISQVASSLLTDYAKGKKKDILAAMTEDEMIGMLGIDISYMRKPCALLALRVLQQAL